MKTYQLRVEPLGGLLLGGTTCAGVSDSTARDGEGVPLIPATALKGALREQLERLLRGTNEATADAAIARIVGIEPPRTPGPDGGLERIGGGSTRIYLSDARILDTSIREFFKAGGGLMTRQQVSLDRASRCSADQRLFARETIAPFIPGLVFIADVDLAQLLADEKHGREDLKRLNAAVQAVFALGAGRSAGLGHVKMRLEEVPEAGAKEGTEGRQVIELSGPFPREIKVPANGSVELILAADEPLCLGDTLFVTNNFHPSLGYLRASTLRGALVSAAMAARHEARDQSEDSTFQRILLDEATCIRFTDAWPIRETGDPVPRVLPFTLRTCKYGGLAHGMRDTLIQRWIQNRLAIDGKFLAFAESCQHAQPPCGQRLISAPPRSGAAAPGRRVVTRLALDRASGRGEDGKLFSLELLDSGTRFACRLDRMDADGLRLLQDATRAPLRVGHGRGQGYGRVRIVQAREVQEETLDDRLAALDAVARRAWEAAANHVGLNPEPIFPDQRIVAVTLESDLVPPSKAAQTSALKAFLHTLQLESAEVLFAAVQAGQRGGYDTLKRTFKDLEPTVRSRSCLLLAVPDDASHRERLAALEASGAGEERAQGYGRLRLSDELHLPGWKAGGSEL